MQLVFEWDEAKAEQNLRKHGISFEEARTVFGDPFVLTTADPQHSAYEDRSVTVGISAASRLLVVVHTRRGGRVRIISCRGATKMERKTYEQIEL